SRRTDDEFERMHIAGHHGTGADKGVSSQNNAGEQGRVRSDSGAIADDRPRILIAAGDLGARVTDVGEDRARAHEDVVFDLDASVDAYVVLDSHSTTNHSAAGNKTSLSQTASRSDDRAGHHVAVVPDPNPGA